MDHADQATLTRGWTRITTQLGSIELLWGNRIQRQAGKLIAGPFRMVRVAASNAELHLTLMLLP